MGHIFPKCYKKNVSLWFSVEFWLQPYSPFIIVKACPVFLSSTRLLTIFVGESACLTQLNFMSHGDIKIRLQIFTMIKSPLRNVCLHAGEHTI